MSTSARESPDTELKVYNASLDELPAIRDLYLKCFDRVPSRRLLMQTIDRITVGAIDGKIVGFYNVTIIGNSLTIGRLGVLPDYRLKGVGYCFILNILSRAFECGLDAVYVIVPMSEPGVARFFRQCTFECSILDDDNLLFERHLYVDAFLPESGSGNDGDTNPAESDHFSSGGG